MATGQRIARACVRRVAGVLAALIAGGGLAAPASAASDPAVPSAKAAKAPADAHPPAPIAGRYRCYQPPTYSVTAWFDLEADGRYRLDGGEWKRFAWDARRSLIRWTSGGFAERRLSGYYLPPGRPGADEDRVTIVLVRGTGARPGGKGWDRLERCYLTMH